MIRLPPDFREFLQLLDDRGVEYMVISGYAVGYHGHPRATGDMDIWLRPSVDNAERLVKVLHEFGFDLPEVTPQLFTEPEQVVRMGNPPLRLELITTIDGVEFDDCYPRRVVDEIDGVPISFIGRDDLLRNKRASGRPQDLSDLDNL